jgi:8-oxo-dGTP diphosphatase
MDLSPPDYQYCPFCKKELKIKIEEDKPRKWCPDCDWTYYPRVAMSVSALIKKDNQVLMVKRARQPFKGTWVLPAGFLDYGEHPMQALEREIKEETNLKVKQSKFLKFYQVKDDPRAMGHIHFCYQVTVKNGELKTDTDENHDIKWFEINNLPDIGFQTHQQVVKDFL